MAGCCDNILKPVNKSNIVISKKQLEINNSIYDRIFFITKLNKLIMNQTQVTIFLDSTYLRKVNLIF